MKRPKVYLVGPMSHYPAYNCALFFALEMMWERAGYDVKTPFELNSIVWQRHFGRDFNPHEDKCDYGDPLLAEMCAEDMKWLCQCDIVAVLPGWERSKGTTTELLVAINLHKDIRDAITMEMLALEGRATLTEQPTLFI